MNGQAVQDILWPVALLFGVWVAVRFLAEEALRAHGRSYRSLWAEVRHRVRRLVR